jgi:hypothetical protein
VSAAWRSPAAADRHTPPVEMRFIDMFMAALGAMIFVALLLSFLLRYLHHDGGVSPAGPRTPAPSMLRIATRSLPAARVGEPYEVAFAYRGGSGPIAWTVPAGSAEIPPGLRFDRQRGVLSGTPGERGMARFILQASDISGGEDRRPLELVVEPSAKASGRLESLFGIAVIVLTLLIWLVSWGISAQLRQRLRVLIEAGGQGQSEVRWWSGPEQMRVALPEGIEVYRGRHQNAARATLIFFIVFLASIAWFTWRLWAG